MYVIDLQGFNYGNDSYMWKEISIFDTSNEKYSHKMIKMPHQLSLFNEVIQTHMDWLRDYVHGLDWNSCYGDFLLYEELADFIKKRVDNEVILVKGAEKKKWLETFLSNQIIDLHDEGCPNLEELKSVFKSYHCNEHYFNTLNCSLENVYFLYYWYVYCKKINPLDIYLLYVFNSDQSIQILLPLDL